MADKKKVTITYDIVDDKGSKVDENGNAYGVRQYSGEVDENGNPLGGSLFVDAYNAQQKGVTPQVYKDPSDSEDWTSKDDAHVDIGVVTDGETADIVISGPEWYAEQVKNSDWFKNNYDNKTFRKLVEMYVNNPNGTMVDPSDDTKTITYSEAFQKYSDAFNETAAAYKELAKMKDGIEGLFGVQLSDEQAMIAGTSYDKSDYSANSAVYIPKWLSEKRDMTKYESWNPDTRTMSAKDFFEGFYSTANWDANGVREIKELARRTMQNQALYGGVNSGDRELKTKLKDEEYKDEVARTISIATIMANNDAESDFGMDAAMFGVGLVTGFLDGVNNFISGAGQTLTNIMRFPIDQFHDFARDVWGFDEEGAGAFAISANPVAAVAYTALSALGEVFNAGVHGDMNAWSKEFVEDMDAISNLSEDNAWTKYRSEYQAGMDKFYQGAGDLSKTVEAGKFIGNVVYKIVENIVLLNAVGGALGKAISGGAEAGAAAATAATQSSVAALTLEAGTKATGVLSVSGLSTTFKMLAASGKAETVGAFMKSVGFVANAGVQGVIETLVDDSDTFNALMATGDTKVAEVLMQNIGYNAMGEAMGWGTTKLGNTATGKLVRGSVRKGVNELAETRYNLTLKAMKKIYGESPSNSKIAAKEAFVKKEADMAKEIADVKLLSGVKELGYKEAISKNFAEQQTAVNVKIAVENAYDAMNASIKQGMSRVQQQLDPDTIEKFYTDAKATFTADAEMIASGKLTKSLIPGNKLSQEASDYLSYRQHVIDLTNKGAKLADQGKNLTANDAARLESSTAKMEALKTKLGAEYTAQLDGFYKSIAGFQQQLNLYKLDNQLFTNLDERAAQLKLMNDGNFGPNGEQYIHTERYFEGENYADKFLKNPTKPRTAKAGKALGEDVEEHFVDPTTMLMLDLSKTASLKVQADWQEALASSRALSKNVVATEEEKWLSDHFKAMRKENLAKFSVDAEGKSDIAKTIREAFGNNDMFAKAYTRTVLAKDTAKAASSAAKKSTDTVNRVVGLDKPSTYAQTIYQIQPEDIDAINLKLSKQQIPSYDFTGVKADEFNEWYNSLGDKSRVKRTLDFTLKNAGKNVNVTNTREFFSKNSWARLQLQQSYILDNPSIMKTKTFNNVLLDRRIAELSARDQSILFENAEKIQANEEILNAGKVKVGRKGKITVGDPGAITGEIGQAYTDGVHAITNEITEAMRPDIINNQSSKLLVDRLAEALGGGEEAQALATKYVTLHNLKNLTVGDIKKALSQSKFAVDQIKDAATASKLAKAQAKAAKAGKEIPKSVRKATVTTDTVDFYLQNTAEAIRKDIQSEFNSCLRSIINGNGYNAIDPNEVYARVEEYVGGIGAKVAANNVVAYPDVANGMIKYIQVDPITADLYNLRPGSFNLTMDDYGTGAQHVIGFFNKINRLFQWGTTGFSLTSFVNQWWRDSFNAVVVGGARPFMDFGVGLNAAPTTLGNKFAGRVTKSYIKRYGQQTAKALQESMSEEQWASFLKAASDAGQSTEEAAIKYVVKNTGYAMLPNQEQLTTVGYYMGGKTSAKFQGEANVLQNEMFENAQERVTSLFKKGGVKESQGAIRKAMDWITEKQWGSWREITLRQNVYASAYGRAIDAGMCVSEARQYATRFALDATTDFARPLMIGDSIAKSVPYFGAAVNGVESFYRLLEIDPTGVAGRFIGGIILPGMAAIGETLADEESRKVYRNIPEYEKEDALIFVKNGEVISIPLPQEISGFFAPFRQAVEEAYGENDKSWVDLISADILGIMPVDMSGFVDLDANELTGDPSFGDRIARGTEKAMSTLLPAAAKSAYKFITGRDPYTGRSIDKSYTYVDDEGNIQIMDSTRSEFAQWFSKQFGGEISPSSAQAIFKDLLGRAGMNIADAIVTTIAKNPGEGAKQLATRAGEGALGVMSPDIYNQARNDWYNAVRELEREKEAIQGDKTYQSLQQKIAFETDPEKLKKMYAESDEVAYKFQSKVCGIVDNLKKKYPGMYNRSRQASVIALLNMNTYTAGAKSAYARDLSKELYYQGRQSAIATMQAFGFSSPEDNSILGYGKIVDGEYKFVYNNPLTILNMGNAIYGQSNINKANIEAILSANDIDRGKMYGEEWRSLQTKADKKAYKAAWNKRVITLLAPYIAQHGVEAVLADYETRDLLDNYIFIDNPYKTKDYLYSIFGGAQ